jgi:hypothetical protein
MRIHQVVRTIAAFLFLLPYSLRAGQESSLTAGRPSGKENAVAQWKATVKEHRPWDDRRGICGQVDPFIKQGISGEEARALLGDPQSERKGKDGVLWTYVLYWDQYFQVIFGPADDLQKVRRYPGEGEGGRDLEGDIGVWRSLPNFYDVRSGANKRKEGFSIAKSMQAGTEGTAIREILGEADYEVSSGENRIWVYALAANSFLELVLDGKGRLVVAKARDYPRDGAQAPQATVLVGDASRVDISDPDEDAAAWMATTPKYRFDLDRRGIGKKMETYIQVGMTKEEVEKLMGKPARVGSNRLTPVIWSYDLHTDSVTVVDFDVNGIVVAVTHVGT